jgi:hypothetical protein
VILLKIAAFALILFALVGAAFQTLGPIAAVPVGLGVAAAGWRIAHPPTPPHRVTHVRITFPADK